MKNYHKKLMKAQDNLMCLIKQTESELANKIEFSDYSIFYQHSDVVFVIQYNLHNAPLDCCIDIIKDKGKLSLEDYLDACI